MQKLNLGLLFGGRSGEHEVSLQSARSIMDVLSPERYQVTQIGITRRGQWVTGAHALEDMQQGRNDRLTPVTLLNYADTPTLCAITPISSSTPLSRVDLSPIQSGIQGFEQLSQGQWIATPLSRLDILFPILHGSYGEDGCLQGLCEMLDLPYVGAGVLGSAVGMDKALFKDVMRAHGIPVLDSRLYTRRQIEQNAKAVLDEILASLPLPIFTKPANLGSSVGITCCRTQGELLEGLHEAAAYDRRILVERGLVSPREIEVAVLGNDHPQASIAGEIIPSDTFYSYDAKYVDGRSQLLIPAPLPEALHEQVRQLALAAYRAADCAGMARVDFLLTRETNELYLSEINTLPGFTPISMYPKLWQVSGLPYPDLIDRLVALALERKQEKDQLIREYRRAI
ncbi:MAG: D-alanine--D-alanine ligase [Longilinea sp.]|nr:D-alanine--D-alanine ligase [Longilinea sp.]MCA1954127.1 D-alanine--D-alanine ligase [Anaerolinea sp.]